MPLVVDSSRAFRSWLEVSGLVQAILGASPNDESDWVEWKNGALMLGHKAAYFAIARHTLGMANRLPENAALHAEGCSYIVVGAEPGQCPGVTEIDPADLDAGIRPYLGTEGPRWSAQYVKPQPHGRSVLVVTVEPPRRGDPIFTLQKEYPGKNLAGAIFVRRQGRTDPAGPGDIRGLLDRYAAADRPITLHVRPTGADDSLTIPLDANHTEGFEEWEEEARANLLPLSPPAQMGGRIRIPDAFRDVSDRDYNEYRAEVDEYLKKCRTCYLKTVAALTASGGDRLTRLSLVNTSDRNYTDIRIEIRIQASSIYVNDPDKLAEPPRRPEVPRMRRSSILDRTSFPYNLAPLASRGNIKLPSPPPKFTVARPKNTSVVITYEIPRIRPEQLLPLDPVLVLAIDQSGGEFEITWRVTVGNVDGVVEGNFSATTVAPEWVDRLNPELVFGQPWEVPGSG